MYQEKLIACFLSQRRPQGVGAMDFYGFRKTAKAEREKKKGLISQSLGVVRISPRQKSYQPTGPGLPEREWAEPRLWLLDQSRACAID